MSINTTSTDVTKQRFKTIQRGGSEETTHTTAYKIPFLIYNLAFERKRWPTKEENEVSFLSI